MWIDDVSVVPIPSSGNVNGNGWHAAYFDDGLEAAAHALKADDTFAVSRPSIVGASVARTLSSIVVSTDAAGVSVLH